jgi:hypothetical protein
MMGPAKWDRELIADPTPQRPRLHEPQMMRVRRAPSADKAGLCSNELEVRTIAVTAGFTQRKCALIDVPGDGIIHPPFSLCGCGSRLNPNLNYSRFWRRGWHRPRGRRLRILAGAALGDVKEPAPQMGPAKGERNRLVARCVGNRLVSGIPVALHDARCRDIVRAI